MFRIVTDTSANLPTAYLQQEHITIIPFTFHADGDEQACLDLNTFDAKTFYAQMRSGTKVSTSQIPPQRYLDVLTPMLEAGEDVLFVSMSSGISGSYASGQIAARQLREEFPARKLLLVDTYSASLVEGLLFLDASDDEDTILIELGAMQNAGIDWTTGDIVSGFDGTWPMLEDQIVVMYDQIRTQNMRRSLIPVTLNGTSGYLVMVFTTANPDGVIAGFTEGYDANGLPVRGLTPLQKGDELIPIYPMLYDDGSDSDEFAEDTFEGDPIIVGDTLPVFEYVSLEGTDSTFYYCFQLTDIFGETELSDFIEFEM